MIKLGWDCGHAIGTAGKRSPDDEREWTFNNSLGVAFEKELKRYNGIVLKRFDDLTGKKDIPLKVRTDNANKWGADYFISFHHNALSGKVYGTHGGVETFVFTGSQPKSMALAKALHPALVKGYGLRDRGIKQANLHIVRETNMPAILIEGGFMDSTTDIAVLRNDAKLQATGVLLATAFAKHVGLKLKDTEKVVPKKDVPKKEKIKEYEKMKMVDIVSENQVDTLRAIYEKAYKDKILVDKKWVNKAQDYSITVGEVAYLSTILVSRYHK